MGFEGWINVLGMGSTDFMRVIVIRIMYICPIARTCTIWQDI